MPIVGIERILSSGLYRLRVPTMRRGLFGLARTDPCRAKITKRAGWQMYDWRCVRVGECGTVALNETHWYATEDEALADAVRYARRVTQSKQKITIEMVLPVGGYVEVAMPEEAFEVADVEDEEGLKPCMYVPTKVILYRETNT